MIQDATHRDFLGASDQDRTFHNIYRVDDGAFDCYPQGNKFPQPLKEIFPNDHAMRMEQFMKDVCRWKP